jgi:hypothetical protein
MGVEASMLSGAMIMFETLITFGACIGFCLYQLWDLKCEKAKAAARKAEDSRRAAAS